MGNLSDFVVISDEDIATYNRDGVVCLRGVMSASEIDGLREGVSAQMANFGKTHTAYDFESIARQVFGESAALDAGQATA